MDSQSVMTVSQPASRVSLSTRVGIALELAKHRLSGLVVLTTVVGFLLGRTPTTPLATFLFAVLGTSLAAAGANTLNQWWERHRDARMERTRERPLPSGRISPRGAFTWGLACAVAGPVVLALGTNLLTAVLGAAVVVLYVLVYTPLKVRTPLNTLVGALCGAIPPVMGWTAATSRLAPAALVLGGILFLWQIPHFLALAWLYREDYRRGGFRMLPAVDTDGHLTGRLVVLYSVTLLPLTALAWATGMAGGLFLVGSQLLALPLVWLSFKLGARRSEQRARRLFFATLLYLPLVLGLLVADVRHPVAAAQVAAAEPAAAPAVVAATASGFGETATTEPARF